MIPALLIGVGLWGNWQSSKALDDVSRVEVMRRPLSDFTSGMLLGLVSGLLVGVHYASQCKQAWGFFDKVVIPMLGLGSSSKPEGRPPDGGSAPYQPGPAIQMQPQQAMPQVYYPPQQQQ
mmetsp:Transcript_75470/g.149221  ORF Transcript_75470/g.149221 Transcript_75470/m.149221 type:complete len:120 (-) Transcript_75470:90-449(-)